MKNFIAAIVVAAAFAGGCASDKKPATAQTNPGALDVMPMNQNAEPITPVMATSTPMSVTPLPMPVIAAPDTVTPATPAVAMAGGTSYTVKKGDTLYRLAKQHYGDGKQWQRIASANPGLSPQSLRVGQTLIIP